MLFAVTSCSKTRYSLILYSFCTFGRQSRPYRRRSTLSPICRRFRQQSTLSPVCTGRYGRLCCRYGRLCRRFWRQIGNNLNSTACRGRHCRQLGRLCRPNVKRPFDFVASVYGAKATRWTCRLSTKSTVLNSTL